MGGAWIPHQAGVWDRQALWHYHGPDLGWVRSMLTPQSLKAIEEPLQLANPGIVARFPRTHIWCTSGGPLVLLLRRLVGPRAPSKRARMATASALLGP